MIIVAVGMKVSA